MFTPCLSLRTWALPLAAALLGLISPVRAAQTPPAPPAKTKAVTNATPTVVEIPKSVFIIPASPAEGKDPFFPLSTRLYPAPVITPTTTNVAPAIVLVELKGISGTVDRRLAIINNRTFEVGEEGEVTVPSGRVRVVCKEIKDDSVRVLVNGQERILHLRPGA
jgi:hypothetical protein